MLKKWLCLMLAMALCLASLSFAEEIVAANEGLTLDELQEELIIDEMPDGVEIESVDDLDLDLPEVGDGLLELEEGLPVDGELQEPSAGLEDNAPKLTLNFSELRIGIKEKCTALKATLSSDEEGETITWSSDKTSVAKVDKKSGKITGVKKGVANITATSSSGLTASCKVTVRKAPGKVTADPKSLTISVGETSTLKGKLPSGTGSSLTFTSKNKAIAKVDKYTGVITGVAAGSTTITIKTFNGKKATCKVTVEPGPSEVFLPEMLTVALNEKVIVEATAVNESGEMIQTQFTYKAKSGTGKISVDATTGKVKGKAVGTAYLYVTAQNGVSTHYENGEAVETVCLVTVVDASSQVTLTPSQLKMTVGDETHLEVGFPEGATDSCTFTSSDTSVATVDVIGTVTAVGAGTAVVTVSTPNYGTASCSVTVEEAAPTHDVEYRLFAVYSYYDSLPFSKRNANSMAKVFKTSEIEGRSYSTKVLGNPSKSSILSGISSFFDETDDDDVSIVYLCSHGHNNKSSYSSYRLSLKGYENNKNNSKYYLTSREIFDSVQGIRGNVILILDSCYSGTFINDMKSSLNAEGGRIAVLTAASNTKATYYNVKSKSVDFFTFFLLQGLGYNEKEGWWNENSSGDEGSYPGYLAADKKGNGDGKATLSEFYNFASNCIDVNIPKYMKKSWYWGDKSKVQKTRIYAGDLKDLVIYQPE